MSELIIPIGLPGSDKSRWIRNQNIKTIMAKDIRKQLGATITQAQFTNEFRKTIQPIIDNDEDVIVDALNLSSINRKDLMQVPKHMKKIAVVIITPIEDCVTRCKNIDIDIINRVSLFQLPVPGEGFNEIRLVFPEKINESYESENILKNTEKFKIGDLSMRDHLQETHDRLIPTNNSNLITAGLFHDIGRMYVPKDDITKYKQRDYNLAAYNMLLTLKLKGLNDADIIEICQYINYQNIPREVLSQIMIHGYKMRFGDQFFTELFSLYGADFGIINNLYQENAHRVLMH